MKKIIVIILIILGIQGALYSDTTDDEVTRDTILDILNFGIDSEVLGLLDRIGDTPNPDYFPLFEERYKNASRMVDKVKYVEYFSRCKNLPQSIIDDMYYDASDDPYEISYHTSLLSALGKVGGYREGLLLVDRLDHGNALVQNTASDAIGNISSPEIIDALLERLQLAEDDAAYFLSTDIKSRLILALGEMKSEKAVPYIKRMLEDYGNEKLIQMYGMVALAQIGDESSLELMEKNLDHDEKRVVEYSGYALSQFKNEKAVPILVKMVRHNNESVRVNACKGLVLNEYEKAVKILTYKYINDPAASVRKEALKSLVILGEKGINELKKEKKPGDFSSTDLMYITEAVGEEANDVQVAFLGLMYDEVEKSKKEIIAKTIVRFPKKELDPVFKRLLNSEDYLVRIGGIKAVYDCKDSSLWPDVEYLAEHDPVSVVKKNAERFIELHDIVKE